MGRHGVEIHITLAVQTLLERGRVVREAVARLVAVCNELKEVMIVIDLILSHAHGTLFARGQLVADCDHITGLDDNVVAPVRAEVVLHGNVGGCCKHRC